MASNDIDVTVQHEIRVAGIAVVRPGDVLIVGLSRDGLTQEQARYYHETIKNRLPGIGDVIVVGGVTALAAYRPDGAGE
nr:hypothetical protein [Micromonospora sp. DSM 115978]